MYCYIHDFIENSQRICIRCYDAGTEFKLTFISLNMGLKGKGRWMPPLKCLLTRVVTYLANSQFTYPIPTAPWRM